MKTISVNQLKGGVGKTTTADNVAAILAAKGYKVLLIDNDKQGNSSKMFKRYSELGKGTHTMLSDITVPAKYLIENTNIENLDIITTNMELLQVDKDINTERTPREIRYKTVLEAVKEFYDYCIIDNAPSLDMSVINALSVANDIIVPIKVDNFANSGIDILKQELNTIKTYYNKEINNVYILFTMVDRTNVSRQGIEHYKEILSSTTDTLLNYIILDSQIRDTCTVNESTFACEPLITYAPKANVTQDYQDMVDEYLVWSSVRV